MTKTPPQTLLTFLFETNRIIWVVELGLWRPLLASLRTASAATLREQNRIFVILKDTFIKQTSLLNKNQFFKELLPKKNKFTPVTNGTLKKKD